ncbi:MlaD family protein [Paraconexibacter sp.]|uniref:MlaD family protein n=1 Tax=Paraconexibacter sp. TaxID=2949640 RepID=UPI0035684A8F
MTSAPTSRTFAFAALAAAAVLVLVVLLGSGGSTELVARFDQAHGLVRGAEVRSGGVNVGKVTDIELGPDRRPRVTLKVDDDAVPREGATAALQMFSLAGEVNRYVDLTSGSGERMRDGATIRTAPNDEPVELGQVLETLDPRTRADVRGVLKGMRRASDGRGPDIEAALRRSADAVGETAELLAGVRGEGDSLDELLRQSRTVVGALAKDPDAPGAAVDALASTLDVTAARQRRLEAGVRALPAGLREPRKALQTTAAVVSDLRGVVADARPAARALVPFSGRLRTTLGAARPTLSQARELVRSAPADLRALRPFLQTSAPVFEQLTSALRSGNPMLDQARTRLPDVFAFFANWADFTANYDANGHAARIGLVFAPPPLNLRGPSDIEPGHLAKPFTRTPGVLESEPWKDFEDSFVGSAP